MDLSLGCTGLCRRVLVSVKVLERSLEFGPDLQYVFNLAAPEHWSEYTNRVGRMGRSSVAFAVTMVTAKEADAFARMTRDFQGIELTDSSDAKQLAPSLKP